MGNRTPPRKRERLEQHERGPVHVSRCTDGPSGLGGLNSPPAYPLPCGPEGANQISQPADLHRAGLGELFGGPRRRSAASTSTRRPPVVTITTPGDNASYPQQAVAVELRAVRTTAAPALATCVGPVSSGVEPRHGHAGARAFAVTATDRAGNSATRTQDLLGRLRLRSHTAEEPRQRRQRRAADVAAQGRAGGL